MAFGIKSFQEKQRRWPFFGHRPAWFGIEHPVEGIHLTRRRQSQPPAGDRFPAPTGDQILQERGWRPCCVNDEYCTALTGRGLKREGSSSELRGADELSPDPGLRPHIQFQDLGPCSCLGDLFHPFHPEAHKNIVLSAQIGCFVLCYLFL